MIIKKTHWPVFATAGYGGIEIRFGQAPYRKPHRRLLPLISPLFLCGAVVFFHFNFAEIASYRHLGRNAVFTAQYLIQLLKLL